MTIQYTPEMVTAYVASGAAWMDEHCPDWLQMIDLDMLDLSQGDRCVLGQTAHCLTKGKVESNRTGSYDDTLEYVVPLDEDVDGGWSRNHGFIIGYGGNPDDEELTARWEMLTIAWKEEIRKRREAQG